MFKKPTTSDSTAFFRSKHNTDPAATGNIQAVPIDRTEYRRFDPSLSGTFHDPQPSEPEPSDVQILQGKELQAFLKRQKQRKTQDTETALQALSDYRRSEDPDTAALQDAMQDQIIASAAIALANLPAHKRRIVIDLINELRIDGEYLSAPAEERNETE